MTVLAQVLLALGTALQRLFETLARLCHREVLPDDLTLGETLERYEAYYRGEMNYDELHEVGADAWVRKVH